MRRRGMAEETIEVDLLEENQLRCSPPLSTDEVKRIAQSIARYQPQQTLSTSTEYAAIKRFNLTDLGNAERLVSLYGNTIRYCYERKRWLIWSGKVWEWDAGDKISTLAKLAVRNIYREAANETDEKKRKDIAAHAGRSESDAKLASMINLAQSEPGIPVKPDDFDTNHWLFNCNNGTIDLRSGLLLPHRKEDLLTVLVPTDYDPTAKSDQWMQFLDRVTGGNSDLVSYLQRAVGYSLTGDTRSQTMFFLYGLWQQR